MNTLWIIATGFMATRLDDDKTKFRNTLYDFHLDNPPMARVEHLHVNHRQH